MASEALQRRQREKAVQMYERALTVAPDDAAVLLEMSGDLGNAGALDPDVGLDLVRALGRLGRFPQARTHAESNLGAFTPLCEAIPELAEAGPTPADRA
jgi:tetratricopeptide (TPR) repeat protein